jgi:hypothetical protein
MLPSRQLFLFESPQAASAEILHAQLEIDDVALEGPTVFSEAGDSPSPAGNGQHWDIHFVFRVIWPAGREVRAGPWLQQAFHDPADLDRAQVGRSHMDVLGLAGFSVPPNG